MQFARQGVRVNALCPGPVNTPLLQELFAKDPERAARRLVHIPMGRFGEAEEIAAAAAFLASRRRLVHHRVDVPRRRRHLRRLRDAAVMAPGHAQRPVVGVTAYDELASWGHWHTQASLVPSGYVRALAEAGASPSSSRSKTSATPISTPSSPDSTASC